LSLLLNHHLVILLASSSFSVLPRTCIFILIIRVKKSLPFLPFAYLHGKVNDLFFILGTSIVPASPNSFASLQELLLLLCLLSIYRLRGVVSVPSFELRERLGRRLVNLLS
jgi:hypothetical protein